MERAFCCAASLLEALVMENRADPDIVAKTHAWLKIRKVKPTCPLCGSKKWAVGIACDLTDQLPKGKNFSVIPHVCNDCAYTMFLATARVLGVIPPAS
jgi:hypothetical protein